MLGSRTPLLREALGWLRIRGVGSDLCIRARGIPNRGVHGEKGHDEQDSNAKAAEKGRDVGVEGKLYMRPKKWVQPFEDRLLIGPGIDEIDIDDGLKKDDSHGTSLKSEDRSKRRGRSRRAASYDAEMHRQIMNKIRTVASQLQMEQPPCEGGSKPNVDGDELGYHTFLLSGSLDIDLPKLSLGGNVKGEFLVASIHFSGYMYDHLNTVAYFARFCALSADIICSPVISLPTTVKRWKIHKSPFAKVKNKETFERKMYTRVIQLYDADLCSTNSVVEYVKQRLPRAVNMTVVTYDYETFDHTDEYYRHLISCDPRAEQYISSRKEPFELEIESRAREYLNRWRKDLEDRGQDS